jgi:hypothetical protein
VEELAAELTIDRSKATTRDGNGERAVVKQSRGGVGFVEEV